MNAGVMWVTKALYVKPLFAILAVKMVFVISHGNVFVPVDTVECFATFARPVPQAHNVLNQAISHYQHNLQVAHFNLQVAHFTTPKLIHMSKMNTMTNQIQIVTRQITSI